MDCKLLELAAKSRKTLEEGERLCFRGKEVINSTQDLLDNIQLLYPRLVFIQGFLHQQIEGIDTLLSLSKSQLNRLDVFLEVKSQDTDNLLKNLDSIIGRLKESAVVHTNYLSQSKSLDLNQTQDFSQDSENKTTLYDYVDIEATLICKESLMNELDKFSTIRDELAGFINKVQVASDDFKNTLQEDSSISLEETGTQYSKEKCEFQEKQANTMAQALLSVASHYDQIKDALSDIEAGVTIKEDMELFILERDTEELSSISDELIQSLRIIESVHEDAIVRQQLFHMVYQEKTDFFRKINMFNSSFTDLCDLVRAVDSEIEEGGPAVEKYLEELWALGTCYEDFMMAYERLLKEIERRQGVALHHTSIANQYNQQLAALHEEEVQQREKFIDNIAPFLPGDLSLSLNTVPALYSVIQVPVDNTSYNRSSSINQLNTSQMEQNTSHKSVSTDGRLSHESTGEDDQSNGAVYESAAESQSEDFDGGKILTSSKSSSRDSPPAPIWD